MASKHGVTITGKGMADLAESLRLMASVEVLVGFPEETTDREDEATSGMTNAALGYIHDNGAPEQNIPARPFMVPGIEEAEDKLAGILGNMAMAVLRTGNTGLIEQGYMRAGIAAKLSIQKKINEGIPPPLALSTLKARARKGRKGAAAELANRAAGLPPSMSLAKPLVDTGEMRNAVNFVIRSRKKRK
jgi:hypothetical protein